MLILILDAETALKSAMDGIHLCFASVAPALFPFLVLSIYLTGNLSGTQIPGMKYLGKLCRIPPGSEGILLTGLLGGYPVGAQAVRQAYDAGGLSRQEARRMLGFCSNAGPAFIFGILSPLFIDLRTTWFLWLIHIVSAILTGIFLPGGYTGSDRKQTAQNLSFPDSVHRAIRVMASICGWVVVFRILIGFLDRWVFWLLSSELKTILSGLLELTNGCLILRTIDTEPLRFLIASIVLSFGGLCVGMQTVSVTGTLGTGLYFPGKLLQTMVSILLCTFTMPVLYPGNTVWDITILTVIAISLLLFCLHLRKNNSSNFHLQGV